MLTSPTLLSNMTAANKNSASDSLSQLGNDYNKFLTLLTAQIQNQDPLEPVDSTQFVAQLDQRIAQFRGYGSVGSRRDNPIRYGDVKEWSHGYYLRGR